ncbi:hypothetical protein AVEN_35694-1 [Araneus ventricosus]|uniref:Uncharacterized protein n=1 Tax=Araneus ventricosus TaxID=182803 RepID=A0A4Y2LFJ9_ARAVE|nr:hypothetical protein AVEN_35694-1 [Araneus ventricosus]
MDIGKACHLFHSTRLECTSRETIKGRASSAPLCRSLLFDFVSRLSAYLHPYKIAMIFLLPSAWTFLEEAIPSGRTVPGAPAQWLLGDERLLGTVGKR